MIQLQRDRTRIRPGFRRQHRIDRERRLIRQHINGEDLSSDLWKQAKDQLRTESHGKCAYCEGKADHVAYGDVEHFRPKAVYWWLAYCYDNYLFSCQVCNQSYKGANFPIGGAQLTPPNLPAHPTDPEIAALAGTLAPDPSSPADVDGFATSCAAEGAHLLDPYCVDPEPYFRWGADDVLREVEIRPRSADPTHVAACAAAVDFLGLNRDELRAWRYEVYRIVRLAIDIAVSPDLPPSVLAKAEALLVVMMDDAAEFAGMVRYFVRVEHGLAL